MSIFKRYQKKKNVFKRKKYFKKTSRENQGRNVASVKYSQGDSIFSLSSTIKNFAIHNPSCFRKNSEIRLKDREYFISFKKQAPASLTFIIAVDVSKSVQATIPLFSKIIKNILTSFKDRNDRIGLIAIQDNQSKILNHPTHNYRTVFKNLNKLSISGSSPLADGLKKAYLMYQIEKRKRPRSQAAVVLISDCFPEPITHKHEEIHEEPAYKDAVRMGYSYKQKRIPLLIIRPRYIIEGTEQLLLPGDRLGEKLRKVSGGTMITLDSVLGEKQLFGHNVSDYDPKNSNTIEQGFSDFLKEWGDFKNI
ncbi:MAG: VWA domain-containing protein [Oligoflexia bacterium]|nr:VWA domain-containing protein [Oligoflexia bacterium]